MVETANLGALMDRLPARLAYGGFRSDRGHMDDLLQFAVPTGRDPRGEVLHWRAPGCRFVTAYCTAEAFNRLGGYMYGVALTCIEEIALLKFEAGRVEADGTIFVSEPDLSLLSKP